MSVIDTIKTKAQLDNFIGKVLLSNTYKHGWFVYADSFNSGCKSHEYILGEGLTEAEANKLYEANKYAVENAPFDYSNIYIENVYDPYSDAGVCIYERIKGVVMARARELRSIVKTLTERLVHPELRASDTTGKANVLKRLGYEVVKTNGGYNAGKGGFIHADTYDKAVRLAYEWLVKTPYCL